MSNIKSRFRRCNQFEVAWFNCPDHVFPKHSHDEFVIGTNLTGRETVTLDRRSFEAMNDQLTLYNPGQVQSSHASSDEWSFISIYLQSTDFAKLASLEENVMFEKPAPASAYLSKTLAAFVSRVLEGSISEDALNLELGDILHDLFLVSGTKLPHIHQPSEAQMNAVAEQLLDQISEPPHIADIASRYGISAVALVRTFKKSFGLPPYEWLNAKRINFARQKLRHGQPLSKVAHDLGYADQPHFNRRFKAATGLTPAAFQQMK